MKDYQRNFIEFALENKVLTFGEFVLKSGRLSPFFFNTGMFRTGKALSKLGGYYASAIVDHNIEYDVLFGPAYKGIPLVVSTACALYQSYGQDSAYAFNRKELKDHGEGGDIVGAPLNGRVLLIDDVITAGTAIRQSIKLIERVQAHLHAVVVTLDRQECALDSNLSAIEELETSLGIRIYSIITLQDIITYLQEKGGYEDVISMMLKYRSKYGSASLRSSAVNDT
jgi:orotate phosphoribosyltransferase